MSEASQIPEPQSSQLSRRQLAKQGSIEGRWRWWYAGICDYRLTHPGCSNKEIALYLKKHENTISMIVNTDMYREYEAQCKAQWRSHNEDVLRQKLMGVTTLALDSMKVQLEKKQDQIPLAISNEILKTGLEALGFGPKSAPGVVINNTQQHVNLPAAVSPQMLDEARMALRGVERQRLNPPVLELGAEPSQDSATGLASGSEAEPIDERTSGGSSSTDS